MVSKFFDKKSSGSDNEIKQLAEELHKPIIILFNQLFILHSKTIFGVLI